MAVDLRALWDFDDLEGSEQRFRRATEDAGPVDRFVLMTQVARALGLQERYDEAHTLLDEIDWPSVPAAEAARFEARCELERGRLFRSAGDTDGAESLFSDAARLAMEAEDDALLVDALHMRALVESTPQWAARDTRRALRVARGSSDPEARRWEASLLNNLGCFLVDAGKLDTALRTFEEAVEVRRRQGEHRETQVARWMVGWTLRLLGRREEALELQQALKAELERDGNEDPYVDEELALLQAADPGD